MKSINIKRPRGYIRSPFFDLLIWHALSLLFTPPYKISEEELKESLSDFHKYLKKELKKRIGKRKVTPNDIRKRYGLRYDGGAVDQVMKVLKHIDALWDEEEKCFRVKLRPIIVYVGSKDMPWIRNHFMSFFVEPDFPIVVTEEEIQSFDIYLKEAGINPNNYDLFLQHAKSGDLELYSDLKALETAVENKNKDEIDRLVNKLKRKVEIIKDKIKSGKFFGICEVCKNWIKVKYNENTEM